MRNSIGGINRFSRAIRGYSLLELAVVIGVAGVLLGSFINAYNLYITHKIRETSQLNADLITSALSNFLVQKGRYPCPARMDLPRTDPNYGVETQCDPSKVDYPVGGGTVTAPGNANLAFNKCIGYQGANTSGGICFEQSPGYSSVSNYMNIKVVGSLGCIVGAGNATLSKLWCPGSTGAGCIASPGFASGGLLGELLGSLRGGWGGLRMLGGFRSSD